MNQQEIEQFYHELEQRLNTLATQENAQENGEWGSQRWNREIKGVLVRLGAAYGYQTCTTGLPDGIESDWGEWLYDVVWLKATTDPKWTLHEVGLVAEIEWQGRDDAWEDYQKLHVAKADVRVMVYRHHPGLLEECLDQLANMGSKDCYIFAVYEQGAGRFTLRSGDDLESFFRSAISRWTRWTRR